MLGALGALRRENGTALAMYNYNITNHQAHQIVHPSTKQRPLSVHSRVVSICGLVNIINEQRGWRLLCRECREKEVVDERELWDPRRENGAVLSSIYNYNDSPPRTPN